MRVILIVGFAFILSGCPGTVNQINRLPDSQSLDRLIPINQPGPLLHEASGFTFPERYGNFQRIKAYQYDVAGLNKSFSYQDNRANCLLLATLYLYPTPRMTFIGAGPDTVASIEREWLKNEVDQTKGFIEDYFSPNPPAVVSPVTTPVLGDSLKGSSLVFTKDESIQAFWLFIFNRKWFLKYRFTYPVSCQMEVGPRLDSLIRQLPWTNARQDGVTERLLN